MQRYSDLQAWLNKTLKTSQYEILPLADDASFRRYFRVKTADKSYVVMDAPPDKEDCHSFVAIARTFFQNGVQVPEIFALDLAQGFLLLSDLGDELLLKHLNANNVDDFYNRALQVLPRIHHCKTIIDYDLPSFNHELLKRELNLFPDWFLKQHLQLENNHFCEKMLAKLFTQLTESAQQQPQVCVHRDYHSRNLLLLENSVGVLDFQDAVLGPITYDAVSLLRDCYISWPLDKVENWLLDFYQLMCDEKLVKPNQPQQFLLWFDWIGLQRHLKVIGIFSRLNYRDGKAKFLNDIPRIFNYVMLVCDKYPEFSEFKSFLENVVLSRL